MINELAKSIHQTNKEKGFWDSELNIGEKLMLVVTELSEALEVDRKTPESELLVTKVSLEKLGEVTNFETFSELFERHVKDSFGDELADAIIRILDLAEGTGVDIQRHIFLKLRYNSTRPHKHGKKY